jgi:hypothetical protein
MPEHDAEKCEAVFGRPIMLQVNGIDQVDALNFIQIMSLIVAAGL